MNRELPERLLSCLRQVLGPGGPRLNLGDSAANVVELLGYAHRHRVDGFVAVALADAAGPDGDGQRPIAAVRLKAAWHQAEKIEHFRRLVAEFAASGIAVMPLKGIALATHCYRALPLRRMNDLDLLVRPADHEAAMNLLRRAGLRRAKTKNRWHDEIRFAVDCPGRVGFARPGLVVDLHWRPAYTVAGARVEIDIERAWRRATPDPHWGPNVWRLADEDLVLSTAVHAADGAYRLAAQLFDLALLGQVRPGAIAAVQRELPAQFPEPAAAALAELLEAALALGTATSAAQIAELAHGVLAPFLALQPQRLCAQRSDGKTIAGPIEWRALPTWPLRLRYLAGYFVPALTDDLPPRRVHGYALHWSQLVAKGRAVLGRRARTPAG